MKHDILSIKKLVQFCEIQLKGISISLFNDFDIIFLPNVRFLKGFCIIETDIAVTC